MTLIIKNLTIGYHSKTPLQSALNLKAQSSEAIALVGSNGTGKSTLLKTIAAIIKPLEGEVTWNNSPISKLTPTHRARTLSYVSTEPITTAYTTVRQLVALGRTPYSSWSGRLSTEDNEIVDHSLELTQTTELAHRKLENLSDGQRQRVMIARALAQQTPLMILDEPTAFLDPENRVRVIALLGEIATNTGATIIYSTHEVELAREHSSHLWELKKQ